MIYKCPKCGEPDNFFYLNESGDCECRWCGGLFHESDLVSEEDERRQLEVS